jgi:hypothetical protein
MDVTLVVDETPAHEFRLRFFTQAWSGNIDENGNVENAPMPNGVPGPEDSIGSHLRFADLNGDGKPELIVEVSRGNSESDESPGGVLVFERVGPDWKHVSAMAFGGGC